MLINRHDDLQDIKNYWNHSNPSNIGLGRFNRSNETFLISKCWGREDLVLINHTNGQQYCYEPYGWPGNTPNEVKEIGYKEISDNFEQFLRSLHYLNWLDNQEIVNMSVEELIRLLQKGLDSFSYVEALALFHKLDN